MMYCRKCYTDLSAATDGKCPKCARAFDPTHPKSFLPRPFPTAGMIVVQIIVTTIVGIICAMVVATFQAVGSSGH